MKKTKLHTKALLTVLVGTTFIFGALPQTTFAASAATVSESQSVTESDTLGSTGGQVADDGVTELATDSLMTDVTSELTTDSSAITEEPIIDSPALEGTTVSAESDDDVGTLTEAAQAEPEGTLVSLHSSNNTYHIMPAPDTDDVPSSYLPVTIQLNDVDVDAYIKGTSDSTVLLYASSSKSGEGWFFFDMDEGTFLNADDILTPSSSIDTFMSEHKFVIMLIAIIVLVILIVVIILLAVSFRGIMKEYEAEIDKLKKENESSDGSDDDTGSNTTARKIHLAPEGTPMLGDKALFPGDDDTAESYADSDYDNQAEPDDDDYETSDDYDDTAFDSVGDDSVSEMKASLKDIDKVLEGTKKYKK